MGRWPMLRLHAPPGPASLPRGTHRQIALSSSPPSRTPRLTAVALATWFGVISAMRLVVLVRGGAPGFDGRLYMAASQAWLSGLDPWDTRLGGIAYAAPPPSLLATAPLTLLPEPVSIGLIVLFGLVGTWWALQRLGLPRMVAVVSAFRRRGLDAEPTGPAAPASRGG